MNQSQHNWFYFLAQFSSQLFRWIFHNHIKNIFFNFSSQFLRNCYQTLSPDCRSKISKSCSEKLLHRKTARKKLRDFFHIHRKIYFCILRDQQSLLNSKKNFTKHSLKNGFSLRGLQQNNFCTNICPRFVAGASAVS